MLLLGAISNQYDDIHNDSPHFFSKPMTYLSLLPWHSYLAHSFSLLRTDLLMLSITQ